MPEDWRGPHHSRVCHGGRVLVLLILSRLFQSFEVLLDVLDWGELPHLVGIGRVVWVLLSDHINRTLLARLRHEVLHALLLPLIVQRLLLRVLARVTLLLTGALGAERLL